MTARRDGAEMAAVERLAAELSARGSSAGAVRMAFIRWVANSAAAEHGTVLAMVSELRAAADAIETTHAKRSCRGRA